MDPVEAARIWARAPVPTLSSVAAKSAKSRRRPVATDAGLWILIFAVRLLQLYPEVSCEDAARAALETLELAGYMDPNEAAAIYALEEPPGDVGAPED
jgi:hypothetical protein